MKSHLIALSAAALLGCLASQAQAAVFSGGDAVYRAERPEKAESLRSPKSGKSWAPLMASSSWPAKRANDRAVLTTSVPATVKRRGGRRA